MGQAASDSAPDSAPDPARAPAHSLASASAPAQVSALAFTIDLDPAPALALDSFPPNIQLFIRSMFSMCLNDEQRRVLLMHAKKFTDSTQGSEDADLLCTIAQIMFVDPQIVGKIQGANQSLYLEIVRKVCLAASHLSRKPRVIRYAEQVKMTGQEYNNLTKRIDAFHKNDYHQLVKMFFFEFLRIVPERPWTDEDAALFLRTLESINPEFARLFTKVFDDLLNDEKFRKYFSKKGEYYPKYSEYSQFFSASVFKALSKVVRPNPYRSDDPETIVHGYGLMYHYRYPMSSRQIIIDLHEKMSTASCGTEV